MKLYFQNLKIKLHKYDKYTKGMSRTNPEKYK